MQQDENLKQNIEENAILEEQKRKDKKKMNTLVVIIILLLLLLLIFIFVFFLGRKQGPSRLQRDLDALAGILPGKTPEEIQDVLNQFVEEGMVNIVISPNPVFKDGKEKGRIAIENIPGNHYTLQVDITLNSNDELIYSSGLIDPGHYIEYIKLKRDLPKGKYPATATFTAYYPDSQNEVLAKVSADLEITVLN